MIINNGNEYLTRFYPAYADISAIDAATEESKAELTKYSAALKAQSGCRIYFRGADDSYSTPRFYYEQTDKSGNHIVLFKFTELSVYKNGKTKNYTMTSLAEELGVEDKMITASMGGVGRQIGCLPLANNQVLAFSPTKNKFEIIDRAEITGGEILLIMNCFGRCEILDAQLISFLKQNRDLYLNVKDFGATGNGVTDDTAAIQLCIETAKEGCLGVFFPMGIYNLASNTFKASGTGRALKCYSNQRLFGEPGATLLCGSSSVGALLFTSNGDSATSYGGADGAHDIIIENLTFDGNATISGNKIGLLATTHGENIKIKDCVFKNTGEWHDIEINSSENVEISGCVFHTHKTETVTSECIQIDAAVGNGNMGKNDGTVCRNIDIHDNVFYLVANPAVGNHDPYNHHEISIHDNTFLRAGYASKSLSRGVIDFSSATSAGMTKDESSTQGAYNVLVFSNYFQCLGSESQITGGGINRTGVRIFNNGSGVSYVYNNVFIDCKMIRYFHGNQIDKTKIVLGQNFKNGVLTSTEATTQ